MVHHVSMATLDHCLLALALKRSRPQRKRNKQFFFEVVWMREAEWEEVTEMAWNPYREDLDLLIQDRLMRCQQQLMQWNHSVFGNVNKTLKQKQNLLQQLEAFHSLNELEEEISALRKEINERLIREEVMWKQRSRVEWLKNKDRNTKFFHVATSQRRRKNSIEGLKDSIGVWHEEDGENRSNNSGLFQFHL